MGKVFISFNNNVVCKPHSLSGGLRSEIKSGVAFVKQKVDIVALEVVQASRIIENEVVTLLPAGTTVYIREERLMTMPWGKQVQKLKDVEIILVPGNEIVGADFEAPEAEEVFVEA